MSDEPWHELNSVMRAWCPLKSAETRLMTPGVLIERFLKSRMIARKSLYTVGSASNLRLTAGAGNRRKWRLTALCAHTNALCETDLLWET